MSCLGFAHPVRLGTDATQPRNELMQDIRVQVYLESLEIDVHESTALFHLLQNGTPSACIEAHQCHGAFINIDPSKQVKFEKCA